MAQDTVMDQINKLITENETPAISPNDGSGDFNSFVNTMEGNLKDVPLEFKQSDFDSALLAAYIKTQGSIDQETGQLFERVRGGQPLSGPQREAFSSILAEIDPLSFMKMMDPSQTIRESEIGSSQMMLELMEKARNKYESMKKLDPSATVREGEYQFPDQSQVGSPRGDYEMNEGE